MKSSGFFTSVSARRRLQIISVLSLPVIIFSLLSRTSKKNGLPLRVPGPDDLLQKTDTLSHALSAGQFEERL